MCSWELFCNCSTNTCHCEDKILLFMNRVDRQFLHWGKETMTLFALTPWMSVSDMNIMEHTLLYHYRLYKKVIHKYVI